MHAYHHVHTPLCAELRMQLPRAGRRATTRYTYNNSATHPPALADRDLCIYR